MYGFTKLVIFAYDELEEGVLPEVQVLSHMLRYFGPLPPGLVDHVKRSPWREALVMLERDFEEPNQRRYPFRLWGGVDGLEPDDKEFFGRILNLDPALRPSAEELIEDKWFCRP